MPEKIINLSKENLRSQRADVVFGEVEYGPRGICGPRVQRDYQLVILHEGTMDAEIDGASTLVRAGQAILLHPRRREYLRFTPDARTRHSWCAIHARAVPAGLRRAARTAGQPLTWTPHLQKLLELGKSGEAVTSSDADVDAQRFLHLALLLLAEFLAARRRQDEAGTDARLDRMQRFIVREHRRHLDLSDLARAAGVSRQHLRRVCRRLGQPPPLAQLRQQRLNAASDLLLHTGLSVKEISEQCGFENPYHFSRKFKQWSRLSPRAYRRLHLEARR